MVHGFDGELDAFPSELRQVLTNVLRNAVEATVDGGTIVVCSESKRQSGKEGVLVQVVDDGVGIPVDVYSKLFNPFVTTKGEVGDGLGLWVSRSIVQKHGGTISISDAGPERKGATVSIFLPLQMSSAAHSQKTSVA